MHSRCRGLLVGKACMRLTVHPPSPANLKSWHISEALFIALLESASVFTMTAASASDRDDDSSDTNVLNQRTHSCGSPLLGPATTLEDDDWSVAVAAKDSEEVGGGGGGRGGLALFILLCTLSDWLDQIPSMLIWKHLLRRSVQERVRVLFVSLQDI